MKYLTSIDLSKNELQNAVIQNLAIAPSNPKEGQIYYNTTDKQAYQYKGITKGWEAIGAPYDLPIASADRLGGVKVGSGLAINSESGVLYATGGGTADAVAWINVTDKPFDELNTNELQSSGAGSNRKLGIKAIDKSKVTGLDTALNSKISGVKKNGVVLSPEKGIVNIEVPTKVSQVENDKKFITSAEAPVQSVNGDTGAVSVTTASIGAVPTGRTINSKPLTSNIELNADDVNALAKSGGSVTGSIEMNSHKITGLLAGSADNDAVTKKQMEVAIASIGNVFNFKGSKPSRSNLPPDGNTIGDVWYVEDEKVGYIWIKDSGSAGRWEQLGPTVDLSGYLTKDGLLQTIGSEDKNAMSQKAVTEALKLKADTSMVNSALSGKADKSTVNSIPVIKTATGTIATSATSCTVSYTGTLIGSFVKDATGEKVMVDVDITSSNVVFSTAVNPTSLLTCTVIYF